MCIKAQHCSRLETHDLSHPTRLALPPAEAPDSLLPLSSSAAQRGHQPFCCPAAVGGCRSSQHRRECTKECLESTEALGLTPPWTEGVGCFLTAGDLERKHELCSMGSFANPGSVLEQSAEQHVKLHYFPCDGQQEQSEP